MLFIASVSYAEYVDISDGLDTVAGDATYVRLDGSNRPDGTITRTGDYISSIALSDGRTLTVTRDANDRISSITDGTTTWTYTRNVDGEVTSWAITP